MREVKFRIENHPFSILKEKRYYVYEEHNIDTIITSVIKYRLLAQIEE